MLRSVSMTAPMHRKVRTLNNKKERQVHQWRAHQELLLLPQSLVEAQQMRRLPDQAQVHDLLQGIWRRQGFRRAQINHCMARILNSHSCKG